MSKWKRFLLSLIGQYYPDVIQREWNHYMNNRQGGWGFFSIQNRNGNMILIDKDIFDRLLLSGYYEDGKCKYGSGLTQYNLIKK